MRAMLVVAVAVAAVSAGLSCSGENSSAPAGLFRSDPGDLLTGIDGTVQRLSYTFHRVSTLDDLTALPACPDPLDPDALVGASTTWGVHFEPGRATVTMAVTFPSGSSCHATSTEQLTFSGVNIVVPNGPPTTYRWNRADQEFDVVIDVDLATATNDDLLSKDATYDWIYGQWALRDTVGNRITLEKTPRRITEEQLRQVGDADRTDLPVPTICHFLVEANDYTLRTGLGNDPELQYVPATVTEVDDTRNDPGCAVYVAERQQLIASGVAFVAWPVHQTAAGDLQVEGSLVYVRQ